MNSNETSPSFIDKLFNRINKNKKTTPSSQAPVTLISNTQNSHFLPNKNLHNGIDTLEPDLVDTKSSNQNHNVDTYDVILSQQSVSTEFNNNNNQNQTNLNSALNLDSSSSSSSSLINISSTTTNKNNLNYDLSPIKEEENLYNRYSEMLSSNININDVLHRLSITNYLTPTYCDYCSQLLMGLIKQGLKCQTCALNYHKRCIPDMPKICNKQLNILFSKSNQNGSNKNMRALFNNLSENGYSNGKQIEIEHTFLKKQSYHPDLVCCHCLLKISNEKYFFKCKDCKILSHPKCLKFMKKNCIPAPFMDDEQEHSLTDIPTLESSISDLHKMSIDDQKLDFTSESLSSVDDLNEQSLLQKKHRISDIIEDSNELDVDDQMQTNSTNESPAINHFKQGKWQNRKRTQIGLQRLSQRVKKTSGFFWCGHMYYYTNLNSECITHYWKLDSKSITIYDSYRLEKKLNEIALPNIKKANLCGIILNNSKEDNFINDQKCLFVLKTDKETFYCGMGNADQNSTMNVLARNFYNIFKMVFLPYGNRHSASRVSLKITAPKYEEKSLHEEYVINPQELLGSGQFGQVYAGTCKANNEPVAIKVIDKTRFKDFQAETSIFQNEITILYNVQHPGIVRLFALFDEVDHLYIVTEKMSTDMLEMILNKQPSRLTERVAKFIIYQILIALNKLHDRNIAHCDLKPENILLTENVEFPQVKICDFGYAKIIGENSFRRSMVGTPAYSPPELKQKRLYNNSIDMWSMGVIVYVSLSGTFPFEEDRDIYEQIMNSNFMFPADPWQSVSPDAIDLINHFLQVKIDRRMSVNKALQHCWFSEDHQLYLDLLDLEKKVNQKWLTTKAQEEKWTESIDL